MLPATEIARRVREGTLKALDQVDESLARIAAVEDRVGAWVTVDAEGARSSAHSPLVPAGPLAGVTAGIKDIIDVAGLMTTAGAGPFAHRLAKRDANVVARLRAAGAIIIGKTATTEFAYMDPAPTCNPWNLEHTPGGSSSGSAAAVAAGMVPVALGTQTVGSVLRPAAFCGVVGFKPSRGAISTYGVIPLAWSFDHVGIFARSVGDVRLVFSTAASRGEAPALSEETVRLGIPRTLFAELASAELCAHVDACAAMLGRALPANVNEVAFPVPEEWWAAGRPVLATDAATYHAEMFAAHGPEYRTNVRGLVESGLATPGTDYVRCQRALGGLRERTLAVLEGRDALLLPVAPGTAPRGLAFTGDSSLCAPASFTGLPSISLPSGVSAEGLPLAIQLVGHPGGDQALLALAARVEAALAFEATPPL